MLSDKCLLILKNSFFQEPCIVLQSQMVVVCNFGFCLWQNNLMYQKYKLIP